MFNGAQDLVYPPELGERVVKMLQDWGVETQAVFDHDSAHAIPTVYSTGDCFSADPPHLCGSDLDLAFYSLKFLIDDLAPPVNFKPENLFSFDQPEGPSLDKTGFAYVPSECLELECEIHVFFHGCNMGFYNVGTQVVEETGLNNVAESNHLIVLYPQAVPTKQNPFGCWDWWGYTTPNSLDYATLKGPQI